MMISVSPEEMRPTRQPDRRAIFTRPLAFCWSWMFFSGEPPAAPGLQVGVSVSDFSSEGVMLSRRRVVVLVIVLVVVGAGVILLYSRHSNKGEAST